MKPTRRDFLKSAGALAAGDGLRPASAAAARRATPGDGAAALRASR